MSLVIYNNDSDDKDYVILNKKKGNEKIELFKTQNNIESTSVNQPKHIKKSYKKKNRLTNENQEFLDSLKSGSGFKILSKATQ